MRTSELEHLRLLDTSTGAVEHLPLELGLLLQRLQFVPAAMPSELAELLELLAQGLSITEIGLRLCLSDRSVYRRQRTLFQLLGVTSRIQPSSSCGAEGGRHRRLRSDWCTSKRDNGSLVGCAFVKDRVRARQDGPSAGAGCRFGVQRRVVEEVAVPEAHADVCDLQPPGRVGSSGVVRALRWAEGRASS